MEGTKPFAQEAELAYDVIFLKFKDIIIQNQDSEIEEIYGTAFIGAVHRWGVLGIENAE